MEFIPEGHQTHLY